MRLGIISIERTFQNIESISWPDLSVRIGLNTGNLMFTEAMFRLLDAEVVRIGFDFQPSLVNDSIDAVVIPAANWLSQNAEWDWLTERLEKLHVPVIVIGLGLQAANGDIDQIHISDSALRLAKYLSRSAPNISVRGETTRKWLNKVGINNVVVTGCPSTYMNIFEQSMPPADGEIIFQGTRYGISRHFAEHPSINQQMFRFAAMYDQPIIYQSEVEEMRMLTYGETVSCFDSNTRANLCCLYGLQANDEIDSFVMRKGHVFYDLNQWASCVSKAKCIIGTRLHGALLALGSGRPAILVPHDSRTAEVAAFAGIQALDGQVLFNTDSLSDIFSLFDVDNLDRYRDVRSLNQRVFVNFLNDSGLKARAEFLF
jgi:hypothetical protein